MTKPTLFDRFDAQFEKRAETECWPWNRPHPTLGYGFIGADRKSKLAHRVAYERWVGPIPDGALIDHMCRNRSCVNPTHLQLATRKTNGENTELSKANRSGVRGVCWDKRTNSWSATVKHNYKKYWAGRHVSLDDAEAAVIALRNKLFTNNLADREA